MFWKIWSRYRKSGLEKKVLVLVSENLASDKKSRFQSGLWSRHTLCSTQIKHSRNARMLFHVVSWSRESGQTQGSVKSCYSKRKRKLYAMCQKTLKQYIIDLNHSNIV